MRSFHYFKIMVLSVFLASVNLFSNEAVSEREQQLIAHVQDSIANAEKGTSKLSQNQDILRIEGMSSSKIRHFLNNICSLPNTNYLEIGVWKGSTWISALFGNQSNINLAVAIDNWSQFGRAQNEFFVNCNYFIRNFPYEVYSIDCFRLDLLSIFQKPVTVYFYDGDHSALNQERAFTYYNAIFDQTFIAIVDDWNIVGVEKGTRTAFEKLGYQVLFEKALPSQYSGDLENWWNGLYVAVVRKT